MVLKLSAFIALLAVVSACGREPYEATAERYSKYGHPSYVKDAAARHCAKYGKTARFLKTDPVNVSGVVSTFECAD